MTRFLEWNSCLLFNPKGESENSCVFQYASFVISNFSVFSDVSVWIWSIHCNAKSDSKCGIRLKYMYSDFASFLVCFHGGFMISKSNFKFRGGWTDILEMKHESFWRTKYVLPVCALEKVWELTKKFLQRSHLVLSHLKQPANGTAVDWDDFFLHLEGAKISLRLLGLRKDEMIELAGRAP